MTQWFNSENRRECNNSEGNSETRFVKNRLNSDKRIQADRGPCEAKFKGQDYCGNGLGFYSCGREGLRRRHGAVREDPRLTAALMNARVGQIAEHIRPDTSFGPSDASSKMLRTGLPVRIFRSVFVRSCSPWIQLFRQWVGLSKKDARNLSGMAPSRATIVRESMSSCQH